MSQKDNVQSMVDSWENLFELFFKSSVMQSAMFKISTEKGEIHHDKEKQ